MKKGLIIAAAVILALVPFSSALAPSSYADGMQTVHEIVSVEDKWAYSGSDLYIGDPVENHITVFTNYTSNGVTTIGDTYEYTGFITFAIHSNFGVAEIRIYVNDTLKISLYFPRSGSAYTIKNLVSEVDLRTYSNYSNFYNAGFFTEVINFDSWETVIDNTDTFFTYVLTFIPGVIYYTIVDYPIVFIFLVAIPVTSYIVYFAVNLIKKRGKMRG